MSSLALKNIEPEFRFVMSNSKGGFDVKKGLKITTQLIEEIVNTDEILVLSVNEVFVIFINEKKTIDKNIVGQMVRLHLELKRSIPDNEFIYFHGYRARIENDFLKVYQGNAITLYSCYTLKEKPAFL